MSKNINNICKEYLEYGLSYLDIKQIICFVLSYNDLNFISNYTQELTNDQYKKCIDLLLRRKSGEPIAYILESQEFYGIDFYVNKNVLIPRYDSEIIVDLSLDFLYNNKNKDFNILEVGTGSGCLSIAISKNLQKRRIKHKILAVDISQDCCNIAKKNVDNILVERNIQIKCCDGFDLNSYKNHIKTNGKFDLILSNPPYIDIDDIDIDLSVKNFEPHLALFAKNNGLEFYEKLSDISYNILNDNGCIILEIGHLQNQFVIDIFKDFHYELTKKDTQGNDRCLKFINPAQQIYYNQHHQA